MARTIPNQKPRRGYPLVYVDDFRVGVTYVIIPLVVIAMILFGSRDRTDVAMLLIVLCGVTVLASFIYIVWTHVLYSRTPRAELLRIASAQHRKQPGMLARLIGMNQQDAGSTALSSAALTIMVAVSAIIIGATDGGVLLPALVLTTAATSWATMVYAFALKYLRLYAAGERITFDIDEAPEFQDFLSMSVMVSSVGAMSAGTPRTRNSLAAVRSHTWISFVFNALVVAMTVSIFGNLISNLQ